MPILDSRCGPLRLLAQKLVVAVLERLEQLHVIGNAGVAQRDEGVSPQVARVVTRHIETVVAADEGIAVVPQPVREPDMWLGTCRQRRVGAALLDAAVPRT